MVTELTDQTFDEKTNNGVTFTDFWATWCGPCRMQSPVIEQLAEEMGDKVFFSKVDVDANQETAAKFGIMSIPTFILFKNGNEVKKIIGGVPQERLETAIDENL